MMPSKQHKRITFLAGLFLAGLFLAAFALGDFLALGLATLAGLGAAAFAGDAALGAAFAGDAALGAAFAGDAALGAAFAGDLPYIEKQNQFKKNDG
jgi:hypothetical protein